jgi:hypothetical protein
MKATFSPASFVTVLLAMAGAASAQSYATSSLGYAGSGYYPGGYGYGYHSSTFEEGLLRGYGELALAQGQANYFHSLAAINRQEAYARYVQNRERATETYFKMRQINHAAREAEAPQRLSREQYTALAKKAAPSSLSERQYDRTFGRLSWPAALTGAEFAAEREALDRAFGSRSPGEAGASPEFNGEVRQLTSVLEGKLKGHISEISSGQYMAAKKFLVSLTYESQQPLVSAALALAK